MIDIVRLVRKTRVIDDVEHVEVVEVDPPAGRLRHVQDVRKVAELVEGVRKRDLHDRGETQICVDRDHADDDHSRRLTLTQR